MAPTIEQCATLATSSSSNVYPDSTSSVTVNNNFEQNGVCVPPTSFLETGVLNDPNVSFLSLLNGPSVSSCDQSTTHLQRLCSLDSMDLDVNEARALVDPLNIVHTDSSFVDVRSICWTCSNRTDIVNHWRRPSPCWPCTKCADDVKLWWWSIYTWPFTNSARNVKF